MIRPRALSQIMDALLGDYEAPVEGGEVVRSIGSSDPRFSALSIIPANIIDGRALYLHDSNNGMRLQTQTDLDGSTTVQRGPFRPTQNGPQSRPSFLCFKHKGQLMASTDAAVLVLQGDKWEPLKPPPQRYGWGAGPRSLNDNSGFKIGDDVFKLVGSGGTLERPLGLIKLNLDTGDYESVTSEMPIKGAAGSQHAVLDGKAYVQFNDRPRHSHV